MILETLLRAAQAQAQVRMQRISFEQIEKSAAQAAAPMGFVQSIRRAEGIALIGELKRASPSAGLIRDPFPVADLARQLADGGADCLSVLTEASHFQGALENLHRVQGAGLPRLQKDFVLSEYQVLEGRAAGADAVLLIAEALSPTRAAALCDLALALDMDVLYEAHDRDRLRQVVQAAERHPDRILVGINNRDLRSFRVDVQTTFGVLETLGGHLHVVAESGIHTADEVVRLRDAGVSAILVGESLMRQEDVAQAVRDLLCGVRRTRERGIP